VVSPFFASSRALLADRLFSRRLIQNSIRLADRVARVEDPGHASISENLDLIERAHAFILRLIPHHPDPRSYVRCGVVAPLLF